MINPVYLDYNATTLMAPEVADAIEPYLREHFGNPSPPHIYGQRAKQAVEQARGEVAALIGAGREEIVFTGCATEANNLAIQGVARALAGNKKHLITSAIEHPSVMQPFLKLRNEGWEVTIQPIADIAQLARAKGILLHTDAAQSAGKVPLNVHELGVDLLTLAGHKFHAPNGVGALYVRTGTPVSLLQVGAGHEHGLRPGMENVPFAVDLGAAARLARKRLPKLQASLTSLRDQLHPVAGGDSRPCPQWTQRGAPAQYPQYFLSRYQRVRSAGRRWC